jgi:cold shock CspA family protein
MRQQGRLTEWNDDRGYGFVTPLDGSARVFVHISEFPAGQRRPYATDLVTYDVERDDRNRLRAAKVLYAVPPRSSATTAPKPSPLQPVLLVLAVAALVAFVAALILSLDGALTVAVGVVGLLLAGSAFALSQGARSRPEETHFKCAGCGAVTEHNERTIEAWRNHKTRYFCRECHGKWLDSTPPEARGHTSASAGSRAGCAAVLAMTALAPAIWLLLLIPA